MDYVSRTESNADETMAVKCEPTLQASAAWFVAGQAAPNHVLLPSSPLPLLVAGIRADHEDDAAAPDDLALLTHPADAGANLHD